MFKSIAKKAIQQIYRNVAPPDLTLFKQHDCSDPLMGGMYGEPVDRALLGNFFKVIRPELNPIGHSILEVGDNKYAKEFFPNAECTILEYLVDTKLYRNHQKILGDLNIIDERESFEFDLIISTQVLSYLANPEVGVRNYFNMLKPGGILLGSEPFLTPVSIYDESRWGEKNRFTQQALSKLLMKEFKIAKVQPLGNAKTSACMLLGIPMEKIPIEWLIDERPSHATMHGYVARKI